MVPKKGKKSGKCDLSPPVLRFLITVCSSLEEKEDLMTFVQKACDSFGIYEGALASRLSAEINNEVEFKEDTPLPGKLPGIYEGIQNYTCEANAEREKLQIIAELVQAREETLDDILSLANQPIVKYCHFCKHLGYNKDHYMNHNFKGGHNNEYICPATTYLTNKEI